jgi:small GTP-binding protein
MTEEIKHVKIVLIGECGVGKTSIISRYITDEFSNSVISSLTASFASKKTDLKLHKKTIQFDIWDTAGQELFRSVNKIFYSDANIVILVYDITNEKSFFELKNYWYKEILNNGEKNIIFGIAGNKNDLFDKEKIKEEIVRNWAKEINAIFYLTSAKNKNGIDELFEEIGKKYLNKEFQSELQLNKKNDNDNDLINLSVDNNGKNKKKCC